MRDLHRCDFPGFRQPVDAYLAAETAGLDNDLIIVERCEVAFGRDDVGFDRQNPRAFTFEPEIETGHISGRDGIPGNDSRFPVMAEWFVRVEEIHRFDALDPIAAQDGLAAPVDLASASAIFRAAPHHPDSFSEIA